MRYPPSSRFAAACAAAALALPISSAGQTLGTIDFPNSGSLAAQQSFLQGVLFLHSFEYDPAARAFQDAQRIDPGFVMAYWGEAMTYNHPVWNEKDVKAGRDVLERLTQMQVANSPRALTAREQAYVQAVEILYADGPKAERDTLYSIAMERLAHDYPDDLEAKAFYALSLIGLSQGDRNIPTYMRAGAAAQEVFDRNRMHPGAAHYIIHSFDDPVHAPLGLTAARAYAKIAPDAAHAQHMTSHIFVARGMWDDVVAANERAVAVVNSARKERGAGAMPCGHYPEWLQYGYLQQGRYRDAAQVLDACRAFVERTGERMYSLGIMRAANVIDTRAWDGPAADIAVATERIGPVAYRVDFTTGLSAAMAGDLETAITTLEIMESRRAAQRKEPGTISPSALGTAEVLERTLRAVIWYQRGKHDAALAELEQAAALDETLPFDFGPPVTVKPPRELLGELLLERNRPADARRQFELALARTPERALTLFGLARAAAAAGETDRAFRAYEALGTVWHRADADLPEVLEIQHYLEQHPKRATGEY